MSYDFSLVVEFNFDVTDSNLFVSQTSPSGPWVFEMFQLPQPCSVNKSFNSNLEFWLFQVAQSKQVVTRKKLWKIKLDLEKKHSPLPLTEPAPFGVTRRNPPSMSSSATLNVFPHFYCDFLQRKAKPGKSYARHFHGPWHCLSTHGNQAAVAMEHRFPIQMYFCFTKDVHLDFCRWTENFIFGPC